MFVSKQAIKDLLIEKGLVTASQFNDRCQKKRWREHAYRSCYDAVKDHFGFERALNKNYMRSLAFLLNGDDEGYEFVSCKRSKMETSYQENDSADEDPLLDFNSTIDGSTMSIEEENVDPVIARKDRLIAGNDSNYSLIK